MEAYQGLKNGVRRTIAPYGLMDSYTTRFIAFAGATAGILWLAKPSNFFDAAGNPYPNSAIAGPNQASRDIDWVAASLLVGLFSITII